MSDLGPFGKELRRATSVAQRDPQGALSLLRLAIDRAEGELNHAAVLTLSKHAAVLAEQLGRLADAVSLYEKALGIEPSDPLLHIGLGLIHEHMSAYDLASRAFALAEEKALNVGDAESVAVARELHSRLPRK